MTTKSMNQVLLDTLLELRENVRQASLDNDYYPETFDAQKGICGHIPDSVDDDFVLKLMGRWPLHTGDIGFCVPANRKDNSYESARDAYMKSNNEHMWFTGEYAELRMELLNWMIKELENDNA